MGSRTQSHKLSNGLYVKGRPDSQPKERPPTMAARAVPYTGGDIKKSRKLGKMFDLTTTTTQLIKSTISSIKHATVDFIGRKGNSPENVMFVLIRKL
ncbi:hypothetical protein BVRB_6g146680 [Beta vulgaris subsp. vulgaris]|nr:hypothetical protein BVRB_6g146680 [Beta vulgaris subsp. vulgaris]